ncbi:MAG TPA: MBL fold metallo-hydrolase [Sedimentisphaerales bacterium]|nr:MBL fold metallo-hydrolase [Sedimentisphaerales bacterium]
MDPGHDFLMNFHDQKFHLRELDAVLVSHNHPDHTHDLKSIDDVKYEMWANSKKKPKPYSLVLDNDTDRSTEEWTREPKGFRKPPIRVDANRQDKVDLYKEAGLPFNVDSFKVEHTKDVPNAVGYRVSCMKEQKPILTVGFSCDTKYFPELCNDDELGGCDILVAHMSQPEIPELKDPVNAKFKEEHLGYRGTIELIKRCKPKLTIISEFWAGLADARILLLQGLRNRCKTNNILPGGVGLLVKVTCEPMSFQILCTNCKKWTQHEKIKIGSSSVSFGPLNYLCLDCCL